MSDTDLIRRKDVTEILLYEGWYGNTLARIDHLPAVQPAPVTVERVQHIKRGTTYTIIARGLLQTDHPLSDYAEVVVYRCDETGDTWIRPQSEFTPDRFRALAEEKPNE
jgi:hypothetical protein